MGTWQRLTGEFRVPYGTERGRIALGNKSRLPNATGISREIEVYLDDITLEQIEHLSIEGKYYSLNKAAAKALLIETLEKANIEHPVEYKILVLNEHQNLVPQTTTKFVEEKISDEEPEPEPTEDELPLEKETEPIETENDVSENEEPGADIG